MVCESSVQSFVVVERRSEPEMTLKTRQICIASRTRVKKMSSLLVSGGIIANGCWRESGGNRSKYLEEESNVVRRNRHRRQHPWHGSGSKQDKMDRCAPQSMDYTCSALRMTPRPRHRRHHSLSERNSASSRSIVDHEASIPRIVRSHPREGM